MVLEDSPPSPTDFTTDYSSPTSDSDPYAASLEKPGLAINLDKLPSPAPLFGPIFGYTNQYFATCIHYRVQQTSTLLQRPISTDEASALAYWTAKMLAIASWGHPLGLAAGAWRTYQTRGTFRFPFWKPDPNKFNPEAVKIGTVELLRGAQARAIWHGLRGGAYGIVGSWVGGVIVSGYAATAAAVGEQQDPRLREVMAKLRAKGKEIAAAAGGREVGQRGREVGQRGDPTGQGRTPASELWRNHRRAIGGDDASPTADGFEDGTDVDEASLASSDGGVLSDQQLKGQEMRQQPRPRTSSRAQPSQPEQTFDDDDAGPTAGTASVWERIRKEAGSAPSPNAARRRRAMPPQQERQEGGEGFAGGGEGEDRAEAQRLFDEQVERERRGGEFAGRGKGW